MLQETHFNTASKHTRGDYTYYFSTKITEEQRKEKDKQLTEYHNNKRTRTQKQNAHELMKVLNIDAEKLGVGIVFNKKTVGP